MVLPVQVDDALCCLNSLGQTLGAIVALGQLNQCLDVGGVGLAVELTEHIEVLLPHFGGLQEVLFQEQPHGHAVQFMGFCLQGAIGFGR